MFLLLLQMLLISWLGAAQQREELSEKKRRQISRFLLSDVITKCLGGSEEILEESVASLVPPAAEIEFKPQNLPPMSNFIFSYLVKHVANDLESWASKRVAPAPGNTKSPLSHTQTKRDAESPHRKDAKKFWDFFMLKTKSRSEAVVLPIKTNEMYQEICSMLPFSQSIIHENCEKLVIQNNLCFGRCSSFHVPGPEEHIYSFCSQCLPTKFSKKHLKMNCTTVQPVIKTVMLIEECRCEVQTRKDPEIRFLHSAQYSNEH